MQTNVSETATPDSAPTVSPGGDHSTATAPVQSVETAPPLPPVEPTNGLDKATDTPEPLTLDAIGALHVSTMPEFDPAIHAVDKDGNPRRRGDGSFALKRGRKAGAGAAARPSSGPASASTNTAAESDPLAAEIEQASRTATNLLIGVSVAVFGQDFVPESKAEPMMLNSAFRDYFAERGVTKLPPEIALAAALAGYFVPRMNKPNVKTRAVSIGMKIRDSWRRWTARKPKGDATPDDVKEGA